MINDTALIKENALLRESSREQLKGKWGISILVCVLSTIIGGLPQVVPYIGWVISLLISGPLALGLVSCFMKLVRDESFQFENLFDGFSHFKSSLLLQLLIAVFTILWSLLLIIPGVIATYRYAMAFYILYDHPEMGAMDALNASKEMMDGYKMKLFCLHLSFIGWALLCLLTLGIGYLWLTPYIQTSTANFYQNLKEARETDPSEPLLS